MVLCTAPSSSSRGGSILFFLNIICIRGGRFFHTCPVREGRYFHTCPPSEGRYGNTIPHCEGRYGKTCILMQTVCKKRMIFLCRDLSQVCVCCPLGRALMIGVGLRPPPIIRARPRGQQTQTWLRSRHRNIPDQNTALDKKVTSVLHKNDTLEKLVKDLATKSNKVE